MVDAQKAQPQFQLVELKPEEAKALTQELDAIMLKYGAAFTVAPALTADGRLEAKLHIFKRVELVPKEAGVPFPEEFLKSNDENPTDKSGGEAQAA